MNSRVISIKIREFLYRFKQLPPSRKVILSLILLAGITVIVGSIMIIGMSVGQIEGKNKKEAVQQLNNRLFELSSTLDSNLNEYGYDKLDQKLNIVEEDYTTYLDELKKIEFNMDKIDLPLSSPVNE